MSGLSDWLDSCFDQNSEHAPVRAFLFGAVITSVAATIASLASDPQDWRLLVSLVGGAIVLGGGCFAMFALPPERFRRLCSLGFFTIGKPRPVRTNALTLIGGNYVLLLLFMLPVFLLPQPFAPLLFLGFFSGFAVLVRLSKLRRHGRRSASSGQVCRTRRSGAGAWTTGRAADKA